MKNKIIIPVCLLAALFIGACGGGGNQQSSETEKTSTAPADNATYDPTRGEGKFDANNFTVGALDAALAEKGSTISNTKCFSCHKTTDEKLVGPGWKGVTERRAPHWLMNFITNPDPMIDKDPEVQAQLELCLVRMPNQNLTEDEAKSIVEFMRKNDGAK
ncbi:c-type cytochrome [Pedobacter sp.]